MDDLRLQQWGKMFLYRLALYNLNWLTTALIRIHKSVFRSVEMVQTIPLDDVTIRIVKSRDGVKIQLHLYIQCYWCTWWQCPFTMIKALSLGQLQSEKTIQRPCTRGGHVDKRTNVRQQWHNPSQALCRWNLTRPCMHACLHAYIQTYIHTYIHSFIHTHIHTDIHTYIHTNTYSYVHLYIDSYIHTDIHAGRQADRLTD